MVGEDGEKGGGGRAGKEDGGEDVRERVVATIALSVVLCEMKKGKKNKS